MLQTQLLKYAGILAIGIAIGATVNGWRLDSRLSEAKAQHAQQIADIARVATQAATQALQRQQQAQTRLSAIDQQHTQELANAQAETDRLRSAVASGERQLRINATCPNPSSNAVRSTAPAPSVDDATSTRLTDAAERDYWTLRARIGVATSQITALQAYITNVCLK